MPDSISTPSEYAARGRRGLRADLRARRSQREKLLLGLGELVFELHREGRREPELLRRRAAELTGLDEELRALEAALSAPAPPQPGRPAARRLVAGLAALLAAGVLGWIVTGGLGGNDAPEPEPTLASGSTPASPPEAAPAPAPAPPKPRRRRGLRAWPAGVRAHTVVLVTSSDERAARGVARQAVLSGLPAGLLRADDFGLGQGLFVVFAGRYRSRADAGAEAARLAQRYPGAYPELIERSQ